MAIETQVVSSLLWKITVFRNRLKYEPKTLQYFELLLAIGIHMYICRHAGRRCLGW